MRRLTVEKLVSGSVLLVAVAAVVAAGCSDDGAGTVSEYDRSPGVVAVVDEVVVPAYRDAAGAVDEAVAAVDAWCADPQPAREADLVAARDAVAGAIRAWERLDPIDMGPVMELRADKQVLYPVDPDRIDRRLSDPPPDAEAAAKRLAADARGLGAAEHLLSADAAAFADGGRCVYLTSVMGAVGELVASVDSAWFEGSTPYAERAAGRGDDAVPADEMLDVLVNMSVDVLGADAKLLGDPGEQDAQVVRRAALAHVATVRALWGDTSLGLASLVSSQLAERLDAELQAATAALEAEPYDAAAAQAALDEARATLGSEVVAALDVTVGFSENDGDA